MCWYLVATPIPKNVGIFHDKRIKMWKRQNVAQEREFKNGKQKSMKKNVNMDVANEIDEKNSRL